MQPRRIFAVLSRILRFARERGPVTVLTSILVWGWGWLLGRTGLKRDFGTFEWGSRTLPYFAHPYNHTWLTERAVEVRLALEVLSEHPESKVLEVGNVLSHYVPTTHTVIDKYETAPGVINADIAEVDLAEKYDLIVAISTLEHVGLDEAIRDEAKPARALERLREHLSPGGLLWVSHPIGYNLALDEQIRSGVVPFTQLRAVKRHPDRNVWREVPPEEAWGTGYDRLLYTAHSVVIAQYDAPTA